MLDVDDTLIEYVDFDFEEWYRYVAEPVAREMGIPFSIDVWRGIISGRISRRYSEDFGVPAEEFWRRVDERNLDYRRMMWDEERIRAYPDTLVLRELPGKKVAWSTSSGDCIRFVLEKTGLIEYFNLIVGKDYGGYRYIDHVKPSPGLLKLAIGEFHCNECVVVGDSQVDMEAARRAGCRGIRLHREGGGDIKSLWELKNILY